MGLTKSGEIVYRCKHSKCEICEYYLNKKYVCWYFDFINVHTWNGSDYPCDEFKSSIKNQCNSHYVHPDYEDKDRFPEKKFGQGKYRFNSKGKRI